MIPWAVIVVVVLAPALAALPGYRQHRATPRLRDSVWREWSWRTCLGSALLCCLSFNLTFFLQEVFLVWPKAMVAGLEPTLYHNNHSWDGNNPLAGLLQGTGALAILISGLICLGVLRRFDTTSRTLRLFLFWMAYNGLYQSLPQVVIGALNPRNDVGMAMDYLALSQGAKNTLAIGALLLLPVTASSLLGPLLSLAPASAYRDRVSWWHLQLFNWVSAPALIAIALIAPYRVPRHWIEVLLVPAIVVVAGTPWLQALAWRGTGGKNPPDTGAPGRVNVCYPLIACAVLLVFFQAVLRPGIRF